ncbi:hypothetical protein, partial [Xenorhabdus littoralis]|uniref:hypothetical protein n=1 Tax=Xenorhabdus littoralis TaxID=2582835 RepID=UPI0029E80879
YLRQDNEAFILIESGTERGACHRCAEHVASSCKNSTQSSLCYTLSDAPRNGEPEPTRRDLFKNE